MTEFETKLSNQAVDALNDASLGAYGNHAYAAGYLGSLLVRAMNEMPKARRAEFRKQMMEHAAKLNKQNLFQMVDAKENA